VCKAGPHSILVLLSDKSYWRITMKPCFVAGIFLVSATIAEDSFARTAGTPIEFTLSQGKSFEVAGIGLKVEATKVRDLTSEGCLGGPKGCPDSVDLNIAHGTESRQLTLQVAHTLAQKAQGIHQARAFGYRVTLKALRHGLATLRIDTP
jgi:hypothetical protein